LPKDDKVLSHLGFISKVFPGSLAALSSWVGFCTSSPQQGVQYQLWYLDLGGGTLYISHAKLPMDSKVLSHLGFRSKVLPGSLIDLRTWLRFCTSGPQQGVKYQLWYLDLGGGDPINIPWKNAEERQSSFPLGVYMKGIARAFNWLKFLGGILHLKTTAGCQISTLIFGFGRGDHINIPWKNVEGRESSFPLGD
jgi:hypothetical protein